MDRPAILREEITMNPEKLELPHVESSAITVSAYLRREWRIDPPYLRLPEDIYWEVFRIRLQGLAEVAGFESQIKAVEARVFSEIAERLQK